MRNRAVQEVSRHRAYRKQAGLGYMDLIASVLIVMVGAVSMGRLMTYSVETAGQSKARAEALALAEAKLEELRDFATDTDYTSGITSSTAGETHQGTNATYAVTWSIATQTAPDYKTATANVAWSDKNGSQQVSLASHLAYDIPVEGGIYLANVAGLTPGSLPSAAEEPNSETDSGEQNDTQTDADPGSEPDTNPNLDGGPYPSSYSIVISGAISVENGVAFNGVSGTGNYGVNCVYSNFAYECTVADIDPGDIWDGAITVATNKVVCDGAVTWYSAVSEDQQRDYVLRKQNSDC